MVENRYARDRMRIKRHGRRECRNRQKLRLRELDPGRCTSDGCIRAIARRIDRHQHVVPVHAPEEENAHERFVVARLRLRHEWEENERAG